MRLHVEGESYEELHLGEDSSRGKYLLRSNGVGRIILGAPLTLSLTVSPHPGQAQAGSRASPSGDETLVQDWMVLHQGRTNRSAACRRYAVSLSDK